MTWKFGENVGDFTMPPRILDFGFQWTTLPWTLYLTGFRPVFCKGDWVFPTNISLFLLVSSVYRILFFFNLLKERTDSSFHSSCKITKNLSHFFAKGFFLCFPLLCKLFWLSIFAQVRGRGGRSPWLVSSSGARFIASTTFIIQRHSIFIVHKWVPSAWLWVLVLCCNLTEPHRAMSLRSFSSDLEVGAHDGAYNGHTIVPCVGCKSSSDIQQQHIDAYHSWARLEQFMAGVSSTVCRLAARIGEGEIDIIPMDLAMPCHVHTTSHNVLKD